MGLLTFRSEDRLRSGRDFREVSRTGKKAFSRDFVILARPNGLDRSRLGLAVGKKVGGAPQRNRIKRLLREFFRLHNRQFPCRIDLMVIAKAEAKAASLDLAEVEIQLQGSLRKLFPRIVGL